MMKLYVYRPDPYSDDVWGRETLFVMAESEEEARALVAAEDARGKWWGGKPNGFPVGYKPAEIYDPFQVATNSND